MADNETDNEVTGDTPGTSTRKSSEDCIKLVPYPKIVFMYPTLLYALVVAICLSVIDQPRAELGSPATTGAEAAAASDPAPQLTATIKDDTAVFLTLIFLGIFGLNLLVLAFDFPRSSSLTLVVTVVALFFALLLLSHWKPGLLGGVSTWISSLQPMANATFYWMFVGIGLLMVIAIKVVVKFDYWEIRPNEILHHHGLWGNLKRYSAPHVRIDKEVNDVFEYMLLGAGRLILQPSGEQRAFVLDNILRITQREEEITKLLGVLKVDVRDD